MSLNAIPQGERTHIALFGRRNAGKSSLINALTGQEVSIVSPVEGTTTDPVAKAMELLPLGPVMLFDTPGIDDAGDLGGLRVRRTLDILNKTDIALLVTGSRALDANLGRGRLVVGVSLLVLVLYLVQSLIGYGVSHLSNMSLMQPFFF